MPINPPKKKSPSRTAPYIRAHSARRRVEAKSKGLCYVCKTAPVTPGTCCRVRSMVRAQAAHVMPVSGRLTTATVLSVTIF